MERPWSSYFQVGLVHFMMYPEAMQGNDDALTSIERLAADPFFEVLEITKIKNPETRRKVRDVADMAHIDLGFGAQPGVLMNKLNTAALDEDARRAAVAELTRSIDQADENGNKQMGRRGGVDSWQGESNRG